VVVVLEVVVVEVETSGFVVEVEAIDVVVEVDDFDVVVDVELDIFKMRFLGTMTVVVYFLR
jgi:hypothetical protein